MLPPKKSSATFTLTMVYCAYFACAAHAQTLNWKESSLPTEPPPRSAASAVYDADMQATLLFGGFTYNGYFGDTWMLSRATGWKQLSPRISPSARCCSAMAYDPTSKTVVLFGGVLNNNTIVNETWTWDGVTWTRQFPSVSPPARGANTNFMVFDAAIGKVVLFGAGTTAMSLNDTWEWDGVSKTWTEKFPAHSPSPREASLAYDEAAKQVVLFGGNAIGYILYGDTWTYDGVDWTQRFPATLPPARSENLLAYDPSIKTVVLFGGLAGPCEDCGETRLNDTWIWSGRDWVQLHPSSSPNPRSGLLFDFDRSLHGLVTFGGWVTDYSFAGTTWFFGY